MPLFRCTQCGCYENTATSNYWARMCDFELTPAAKAISVTAESEEAVQAAMTEMAPPPLCSACDPQIGAWHGHFEQKSANGMLVGDDGFLWSQSQFDKRHVTHTKPRGRIVDGREVPLDHPNAGGAVPGEGQSRT